MKKSETRYQNISNFLVVSTGLLLAWNKYFATSTDPYSSASSPWQIRSYNAHILTAPILVFAIALIWNRHIWPRWKNGTVREFGWLKINTGRLLMFLIVPMIWSGYGLQITADELWRKILITVHLVTSGAWTLGFVLHLIKARAKKRSRK
jgi:hypothetical protein